MSHVETDLIGNFVWIPSEGDSGWVRAVYVDDLGQLMIVVQRDNPSSDLRKYLATSAVLLKPAKG